MATLGFLITFIFAKVEILSQPGRGVSSIISYLYNILPSLSIFAHFCSSTLVHFFVQHLRHLYNCVHSFIFCISTYEIHFVFCSFLNLCICSICILSYFYVSPFVHLCIPSILFQIYFICSVANLFICGFVHCCICALMHFTICAHFLVVRHFARPLWQPAPPTVAEPVASQPKLRLHFPPSHPSVFSEHYLHYFCHISIIISLFLSINICIIETLRQLKTFLHYPPPSINTSINRFNHRYLCDVPFNMYLLGVQIFHHYFRVSLHI